MVEGKPADASSIPSKSSAAGLSQVPTEILPTSQLHRKKVRRQDDHFPKDTLVNNGKYRIEKVFGKGSFGQVYKVEHCKTRKKFAMKVAIHDEASAGSITALEAANMMGGVFNEYKILEDLSERAPVPTPYDKGVFTQEQNGQLKEFYYVVMDFLGNHLDNVMNARPEGCFNDLTCTNLAIQMLNLLQCVHDSGYLHRDLKPQNFVIGNNTATFGFIYLLDFGLSLKLSNTRKGFCGTEQFASAGALRGVA